METKLQKNVKMDYVIFSRGVVGHCIGVRLGYVVGLKSIASIGKTKPSLNGVSKRTKTRGNYKWGTTYVRGMETYYVAYNEQ